MWNFLKKRRETARAAEQQRKFEALRDAQESFMALYKSDRPATVKDELARVKASIERGLRGDQG